MRITLAGPISVCLSAGILLLSKARTFGQPLQVYTTHPRQPYPNWEVPCLMHSPILAALGLPTMSHSEVISLGGDSVIPLAIHIDDTWIKIDRAGAGENPITKELLRVYYQSNSSISRIISLLCSHFVVPREPAVFDLLLNEKISVSHRYSLLKVLRETFRMRKPPQHLIKQLIVVEEGDVMSQWESQREALSMLLNVVGLENIETLLNTLSPSTSAQFRYQILEWSQYFTIPKDYKMKVNLQPIGASISEALGNTSKHHPVKFISQRYEDLGGRWGASDADAIHIAGPSEALPSEVSDLLAMSDAAQRHAEHMWSSIMGRDV